MVRRPAAVADALILVVLFQGIARARSAEDPAAPPAVVPPPPRHGEDALAAEAGLRGGVGDPELVFVGVGAHCGRRAVFLDCSAAQVNWLLRALLAPACATIVLVLVLLLKASLPRLLVFEEAPLTQFFAASTAFAC